jgi:hypothetical protein
MTLKVFSFSFIATLLFILTSCEPVDTMVYEYEEEEKENNNGSSIEDWIEVEDSTVIELYPEAQMKSKNRYNR